MKNKVFKISIFLTMIASLFAIWFLPNTTLSVYAANEKNNYLLMSSDGVYTANSVVGSSSGDGKYVVGDNNIKPVEARANLNFQLVGWQIKYINQDNRIEYVYTNDLDANNSKVIDLKNNNVTQTQATIAFFDTDNNGYFESGKFTLHRAFENVEVSPIYDHIYYKVDVTNLVSVSSLPQNVVDVSGNTLHYSSKTDLNNELPDVDTFKYSNSILEQDGKYYFIENVYEDISQGVSKFYTVHQTLSDVPHGEVVDILKGAYRFGENVDAKLDILIIEDDFVNSKNIDVVGFNVDNVLNLDPYATTLSKNYFKTTKDGYLRTKDCEINFDIVTNSKFINSINISYHSLYIATLDISVNNTPVTDSQLAEILAGAEVIDNRVQNGNITISNYYSLIDDENFLQFFVKDSSYTYPNQLTVNCAEKITITDNGITYVYYTFDKLDNAGNNSKTYTRVNNNFTIDINYVASEFDVLYVLVEYEKDGDNIILNERVGNVLESESLIRGGQKTIDSIQELTNVGYNFIGFTKPLTAVNPDSLVLNTLAGIPINVEPISDEIVAEIDETHPMDQIIYLCFEKIEYTIQFTNFNKIKLNNGNYPLQSITFATNNAKKSSHEITATDLKDKTNIEVAHKVKINETTNIISQINEGFNILGYSFKNVIISNDDYFVNNSFIIDEDLINGLNGGTTFVVYVFEEYLTYDLTYIINKGKDLTLNQDVIMAKISAQYVTGTPNDESDNILDVEVLRYDLAGNLLEDDDNTTLVAKIVVKNLKYHDSVDLISEAIYVEQSDLVQKAYYYAFNYFTEDHKLHLGYTPVINADNVITKATHTEEIEKTRTIEVVYTIPNTRVVVSIEEEFATSENFSYNLVVKQEGGVINPINMPNDEEDDDTNGGATGDETEPQVKNVLGGVYIVDQGYITLTVEKIEFGYEFVGYLIGDVLTTIDEEPDINGAITFSYNANTGANNLVLKFKRTEFKFKFVQNGAGKNDEIVKFETDEGLLDYVVLDIDNRSVNFEKPTGYYVATVHMGDGVDTYSTLLSETNDYRNNNNITTYKNFALTKDQFVEIVQNINAELFVDGCVTVSITYVKFTYTITVNRLLDNEKSGIIYPQMEFRYADANGTATAVVKEEKGLVSFSEIPYGVNGVINVLTGVQAGIRLSGIGWVGDLDGLSYNSNYLNIGAVYTDYNFGYQMIYVGYKISVVYASGQGEPSVYVNSKMTNDITLFDDVVIYPNAIREVGYTFKNFKYQKARYTPYEYQPELWETTYSTLYVLKDGTYVLNTSNIYNANTIYYVADVQDIVATEFYDTNFDVSNYVVTNEQYIVVIVEYELLKMEIVNNTKKPSGFWSLTNKGQGESALQIDLNDFANYKIEILDSNNQIVNREYVTYYDTVTVAVSINTQALNSVEGIKYDLTKGLILTYVYINATAKNFTPLGNGVYQFSFYVGSYMPKSGEIVNIDYIYEIKSKTITVSTVVEASETAFYQNITMYVNANKYDPDISLVANFNKEAIIDPEFQFLEKADIYAKFSSAYSQYFEVSGVILKVDGQQIDPKDYAKYGVSEPDAGWNVVVRLCYNLEFVFKVQPKITYNNSPDFSSIYKCDENGVGIEQKLTYGYSNENIVVASMLVDRLIITYYPVEDLTKMETSSVTNAGEYRVVIKFKAGTDYAWLEGIQISDIVTFTIDKKEIFLSYNEKILAKVSQEYNGTSEYSINEIYKYLVVTDNANINISYTSAVENNRFVLENIDSYISYNKQEITEANEDVYYDFYLYNIALMNNENIDGEFNDNFDLKTTELYIKEFIQITRRELDIKGLKVYSKVYDGSEKAELVPGQNISLSRVIPSDIGKIVLDIAKLNVNFENKEIGMNKNVIITAEGALIDIGDEEIAKNYKIKQQTIGGLTIYRDQLTLPIKGLGEIKVINTRGLTDKTMMDLIPVNSYLEVEAIYPDTPEYTSLYRKISGVLKRTNVFGMAYRINIVVDGEKQSLNNNLFVQLPNVKNLSGLFGLGEDGTTSLKYQVDGNNVLVDLSSMEGNMSELVLTQKRVLLKAWQIVLIVLLGVLVVAGVVITFIIIRKRKIDRYSLNEKI